MTHNSAKQLFGKRFIGSEELKSLSGSFAFGELQAPPIPFSESVLASCADTHLLLFTPAHFADGNAVSIVRLRELFGMNPLSAEPCMYNQDWYLQEQFASAAADGEWHLIRKEVLEAARTKRPEEIEATLDAEAFAAAITYAFAFFAYWLLHGEVLWKHDFLWCKDRDHNGDRIYVGRYTDPAGINQNGFNIHRHLSLRPPYSAAPELLP